MTGLTHATLQLASAPAYVTEVMRAPGRPLDTPVRAYMEPRFGHSFAQVRIHDDTLAAESAHEMHARAFAIGNRIIFGHGQYEPATRQGLALLAHELAHVVQQGSATPGSEINESKGPDQERDARRAAARVVSGSKAGTINRSSRQELHRLDLAANSLDKDDVDPVSAKLSLDYVDNNIASVGLRESWSGLSVTFIAVTISYRDGSILDIPINSPNFQSALPTGQMQLTHFRRHVASGKIFPLTWRGSVADLAPIDPLPQGSIIFAKSITPNIIAGFDDALVRRAFAFAGEIAQIWNAALGARAAVQVFSATQAAAINAAARGASATGGLAAARAAAAREAQRQALAAEKQALIAELRAARVKFSETQIVQIVRTTTGKIVWLEKGTASAGLEHIMQRHGSQFAQLGVSGESNVAKLVTETLATKTPISIVGGAQTFKVTMGAAERQMRIVIGSNGFIVTAIPL